MFGNGQPRVLFIVVAAVQHRAVDERENTPGREMAFRPGQPWLDTAGAVIDAHGGGLLIDSGKYYWYGSKRNRHPCAGATCHDAGINLYSSTDLYSWSFESLVVNVSASISPTGNGLDLERPKVIKCAKTREYVMWVRGTGKGNTPQLLGVLKSPKPTGPFAWVRAHDPFHTVAKGIPNYPPGYQYADATLWQQPSSGRSYVYWRSRVDPADTGFRGMELTDDCLDVVWESDTQIFRTPNREAPAVFSHAHRIYLWTSGTEGWSPCQPFLYNATEPLGPFNSSIGHSWHTYSKPANFSRAARNYLLRDGYLPGGNDWIPERNCTLPAAQTLCASSVGCQGFSFVDHDRQPAASRVLSVAFKTTSHGFVRDDAFGFEPPPIPNPGKPGNRKEEGEPGVWAFASQSTYILPNPAFRTGSKLPQFIYIAGAHAAPFKRGVCPRYPWRSACARARPACRDHASQCASMHVCARRQTDGRRRARAPSARMCGCHSSCTRPTRPRCASCGTRRGASIM